MMDMGWAEIGVLFVLALLIFGPDKLPKLATDAAGMIRKLRELAQNAQSGLTDQGIDVQGIKTDLQSVAELHPKKIVGSVVSDLNAAATPLASAATLSSKSESETSTAVDQPTRSAASVQNGSKSDGTAQQEADSVDSAITPKKRNIQKSNTKFDPDAT